MEVPVSIWKIHQLQAFEGKDLEVRVALNAVAQRSPNFLKQAVASDAGGSQSAVEGARVPEQTLIAAVLKAPILVGALACLAE